MSIWLNHHNEGGLVTRIHSLGLTRQNSPKDNPCDSPLEYRAHSLNISLTIDVNNRALTLENY